MEEGHSRRASVGRSRVVVREDRVSESALEHLQVIRETMEQSASFTAVSGKGLMAIGATALFMSVVAARHARHFDHWMLTWLKEAAAAVVIAAVSFGLKARRTGVPVWSGSGRKMLFGLVPPLAAGAVITAAMWMHGGAEPTIVPGMWLLLYGVGAIAGGAQSLKLVPAMGVGFVVLGVAALVSPVWMMNLYMAAGFGGLHVIFGGAIALRHGG